MWSGESPGLDVNGRLSSMLNADDVVDDVAALVRIYHDWSDAASCQ